jgi:hypothetical protein
MLRKHLGRQPRRALAVGAALLAACSFTSTAAPATTTSSTPPSALDEGIELDGVRFQSTPRDLYATQTDRTGVADEPSTGSHVTAIRAGDRLCITLNESGKSAPDTWCDTAAPRLPEDVTEPITARVEEVRGTDGVRRLVAFGAVRTDVARVEVDGGSSADARRTLPFWGCSFFAVSVASTPVAVRLLDAHGNVIGTRAVPTA